ncbi:MAG: HEAT repeat domain-containing protein [Cyanobacteria bacterium SID2]|nr:HEAT repeat domain-containing protein [Cyanobacteria bacterium SID2]MBP0005846.1 HEAT repeat domain-containing protein [Cyanobacteria bacterium SBC]
MDKRFLNIFGLTEEQALDIIATPLEQLEDPTARYVAASHLMNFPTERSIEALIGVVRSSDSDLYNRIARRKAIESLGRLQSSEALPVIRECLADEDCYTVETAVWAIGEIGTQDETILEEIAQLLKRDGQNYRVIIQTLAKFNYKPALARIQPFTEDASEPIASAAISAIARLTGDSTLMSRVVEFLQHESVNARRGCIQDLIDAQYCEAIPQISRCPVSVVFRLRGIRTLAASGIQAGKLEFESIEPDLDRVILDRPYDIDLVHEYDRTPTLEFAVQELYHTDFGRCYLASRTLLDLYAEEAPKALLKTWEQEAHNDYGAHYHVLKLLGWLKYAPAYDLLVESLQNTAPQFQKSRAAAAIALGNLGDDRAIPLLQEALDSKIFMLQYASLLALQQIGDDKCWEQLANDPNVLIRSKAMGAKASAK